MKNNKIKRENWLTVPEAARRLNVRPLTVRLWADSGLIYSRKTPVIRYKVSVAESSLANALTRKCLYCGKMFRSKRPRQSRFCSTRHRLAYYYFNRTKANRTAKKSRQA